MSDETKRLLKCEFRYCMQSVRQIAIVIVVLTVWFRFMYGEIVDMFLLLLMFIGIILVTESVSDWQLRNSLYVSMGVSRKNVYRAIVGRGIFLGIIALFIEAIIGILFYPDKYNLKLLFVSLGFFLICHGFGQFVGTLMYQKNKIGSVLSIIGVMAVSGVCTLFIIVSSDLDLPNIAEVIRMSHVAIVAVLAACIWGFGMYRVHKQMKDFAVR